tara:strand:+ start:346180 stop:347517 length:1338 start_codon:yes stop_codon:yes gene_type:complete
MNINWFILFILIITTFFVIYKKEFKYIDAFVFFIPFNATVLFFTPDNTAVNLPFVLFFLATVSFSLRRIFHSKFTISNNNKNTYNWLFIIALIAIISQIMPYIINGNYLVLDRYGETVYWAKEKEVYPSTQWITQTVYFLIGLLVVFIISATYNTLNQVKKLLKLLFAGIAFMVFWGWLGDLTYFLNIPYPHFFNQIGMNAFEINEFNGFPRMASVTMEPSYFAQILIPITPYFYWFSQQEKPLIFSKTFHKRMYILAIMTLPLAITTTGVFGFFLLIGLWLKNNIRFFSLKSKYFLVLLYLVAILISIFFAVNYLINISGTYSGIERFKTVHYGVLYFIDYPILGLGWGVFPTYDFLINLLVNFGLIGTIPFLILMYNIFIKLYSKIKNAGSTLLPLYKASMESFVLILLVSQLSGFIYHSQYFWLYLGLAVSIGSLKKPVTIK